MLTVVYTPAYRFKRSDVPGRATSIVSIVRLATESVVCTPRDSRDDSIDVKILDLGRDVDVVGVEQAGIVEWRKDRFG